MSEYGDVNPQSALPVAPDPQKPLDRGDLVQKAEEIVREYAPGEHGLTNRLVREFETLWRMATMAAEIRLAASQGSSPPAPDLSALREFVQKIADRKKCTDTGEEPKCYLDSGPYCGQHTYEFFDTDIDEARALLATLPRATEEK